MNDIKINAIYQSDVQQGVQIDMMALQSLRTIAGNTNTTNQILSDGFRQVTASIESMSNAVNKSNLPKITKDAESATKSTRGLSGSVTSLADRFASTKAPLTGFFNSLARIAKLRVLRGIIRSITSGIREGIQNIYQYSAALNNVDASHMKGSLDSAASSFLYMKNAVASAIAPLIAQLIPTLVKVTEWFVNAASAVAQFFAVLGGQTMYTRAKKTTKSFADIGGAVGGATKAMKEYQNTILGFDELNVLNDTPSTGGGGGGGGASAPDYSDMFEEVPIEDNWLTRFAKFLKENWEDVLDIVKTIGKILLGWKIAKGVLNFFDRLGFGKAGKVLAGLTIAITGFSIEYEGSYDIGYNGPDLWNIIKTAIGGALGVAGSALITSALGVGGGVGAVIGIGVALLVTIAGITTGMMDKYYDDTLGATNAMKSLGDALDYASEMSGKFEEAASGVRTEIDKINAGTSDYGDISDVVYGESLIERIKELSKKTGLTAKETEELKTKCEILNGLGLDGIKVEYDELTGKVTANWQEIDKVIDKLKEQAKTAAMTELLTEAYKKLFEAESKRNEIKQKINRADAIEKQTWADYQKYIKGLPDNYKAVTKEEIALEKAHQEAVDTLDELKGLYKENGGAIDDLKSSVDYLEGSLGKISETQKETKDATDKNTEAQKKAKKATNDSAEAIKNAKKAAQDATSVNKDLKSSSDDVVKGYDEVKDSAKGAKEKIEDFNKVDIKDKNFDGLKDGIGGIITNVDSLFGKVKKLIENFDKLGKMKVKPQVKATFTMQQAAGKITDGIPRYAMKEGGYVPRFDGGGINTASIFLAHENGIPEMVGRIGNRTAVANQGQMVDALAQGVAEGFMAAQGGNENVEFNVYLDRTRLAQAVTQGQRNLNRRYNVAVR